MMTHEQLNYNGSTSPGGLWLVSGNENSTCFRSMSTQWDYSDFVESPVERLTLVFECDSLRDTYRLRVEAHESRTGNVYWRFGGIERKALTQAAYTVQFVHRETDGFKVSIAKLSGETFEVRVKATSKWEEVKSKIEPERCQEEYLEVSLITTDGSLLQLDHDVADSCDDKRSSSSVVESAVAAIRSSSADELKTAFNDFPEEQKLRIRSALDIVSKGEEEVNEKEKDELPYDGDLQAAMRAQDRAAIRTLMAHRQKNLRLKELEK
eukprot:TRINITY_DN38044_c0_g1_i1.p1 TRINITY_DN38044_c0_g1~~TRINITY_DN38044_c0_g1_i1.p1  ORF type:complete len:266 (+),score=56.95 TRINITY_DN38044_c0_g1_i1:215-1012(+)